MSFTQEQIDATAKELHQHVYLSGSTSTDDRWQDYRDVARKALEAGHVGAPETVAEPVAWAIYGRVTGALRYVLDDEDVANDLREHYDVVPLHPARGSGAAALQAIVVQGDDVPTQTLYLGSRLDNDTMITIEHRDGNTVRGTVEQVLDSHLAKGWRLIAGPERRVPLSEAADVMVEAAAQAIFEDPLTPGEYTWAQMVAEYPSRADIWRDDARRVLAAAGALPPRMLDLPKDAS